jgi:Icc-related predicted phosphoesterase
MAISFFVSDLHGRRDRYEKLFDAIDRERPVALFLGGDLLPHVMASLEDDAPLSHDFLDRYLVPGFTGVRRRLGAAYPRVFLILGNDDARIEEDAVREAGAAGLWEYAHERRIAWDALDVYGYSWVPPTPFRLKDWERYDVSRHVEPGCSAPEDGWHTVPIDEHEIRYATMRQDMERLTGDADLSHAVLLFHSPPYDTALDRAALDGKYVDHAPLDVHVGSIAVRRLIEERQPLVTLHGHVHESARLTGRWRDQIGRTHAFSAAHDGPELALVRFDPARLDEATRELL